VKPIVLVNHQSDVIKSSAKSSSVIVTVVFLASSPRYYTQRDRWHPARAAASPINEIRRRMNGETKYQRSDRRACVTPRRRRVLPDLLTSSGHDRTHAAPSDCCCCCCCYCDELALATFLPDCTRTTDSKTNR